MPIMQGFEFRVFLAFKSESYELRDFELFFFSIFFDINFLSILLIQNWGIGTQVSVESEFNFLDLQIRDQMLKTYFLFLPVKSLKNE